MSRREDVLVRARRERSRSPCAPAKFFVQQNDADMPPLPCMQMIDLDTLNARTEHITSLVDSVHRWWPTIKQYQDDVKRCLERPTNPVPLPRFPELELQLRNRTNEVYLLRKRLEYAETARLSSQTALLRDECTVEIGDDLKRMSAVNTLISAFEKSEKRRRKLEILFLKQRASHVPLIVDSSQSARTLSSVSSVDVVAPTLRRSEATYVFKSGSLNDSFEEELFRDSNTCNNA